jgi:hypothetical protein
MKTMIFIHQIYITELVNRTMIFIPLDLTGVLFAWLISY